jgi:hypothetical protein
VTGAVQDAKHGSPGGILDLSAMGPEGARNLERLGRWGGLGREGVTPDLVSLTLSHCTVPGHGRGAVSLGQRLDAGLTGRAGRQGRTFSMRAGTPRSRRRPRRRRLQQPQARAEARVRPPRAARGRNERSARRRSCCVRAHRAWSFYSRLTP